MNRIAAAATGIGLLALVLAIVALATRPEGTENLKEELAAIRTELDALGADLAEASSRPAEVTELTGLKAEVAGLSERTDRLAASVAEAAEKVAAGGERDKEVVREVMREEWRGAMDRMRGNWGRQDMSAGAIRERVGVDEEKAGKVAKLYEKRSDAIRKVWTENQGGGREENVRLMNAARKKSDDEIAELLTPEELEKFKEMSNRNRWGGHRRGRDRRQPRREERPAEERPAGDREEF